MLYTVVEYPNKIEFIKYVFEATVQTGMIQYMSCKMHYIHENA